MRKMHSDKNHDILSYVREHPSLRNPLSFFRKYVQSHELSIKSLKEFIVSKDLYANFYEILNILFDFLKNDYSVPHKDARSMSLCIN